MGDWHDTIPGYSDRDESDLRRGELDDDYPGMFAANEDDECGGVLGADGMIYSDADPGL